MTTDVSPIHIMSFAVERIEKIFWSDCGAPQRRGALRNFKFWETLWFWNSL